jgi:hypothetical protein
VELVCIPGLGIGLNVVANFIEGCFITNDVLVIIALPDGNAGGIADLVNFFGRYGFACAN